MFYHFQDTINVIRRYEAWYYIQFYSYYIILYFESDWSRIRPLLNCFLHKINLYSGRDNYVYYPSANHNQC